MKRKLPTDLAVPILDVIFRKKYKRTCYGLLEILKTIHSNIKYHTHKTKGTDWFKGYSLVSSLDDNLQTVLTSWLRRFIARHRRLSCNGNA